MLKIVKGYPIGIDVNDGALTAAQFQNGPGGPRLRGLIRLPLAAATEGGGEEEALAEALRRVRSSGLFNGRKVVLNLPLQHLSFFPVQFPFDAKEGHEEGILREAAKLLSYPAEEAMIDYPSLIRIEESWHGIVVAARRQVVQNWLALFAKEKLTVDVIEFYMDPIIRLHRRLIAATDRADIVCHVGSGGTMLAVVAGEGILSISEIPWGIQSLREMLENRLSLPTGGPEALALLSTYGFGYIERENPPDEKRAEPGADEEFAEDESRNISRAVFQVISPIVNGLAYECHNTIGYVRSLLKNVTLGKVYLYGLAGLVYDLDRYLEEQVELPVQFVDPAAYLEGTGGKTAPPPSAAISPVPALGLALRGL